MKGGAAFPERSSHGFRPGFLLLLLLPFGVLAKSPDPLPVVTHDLEARVAPETGRIKVTDHLRLPPGDGERPRRQRFVLHEGLVPVTGTPGVSIRPTGPASRTLPLEGYELGLPAGLDDVRLDYEGVIRHDLERVGGDVGRAREDTPGTISPAGVFLNGASGWYPLLPNALQRFRLRITLPSGWKAVSQGEEVSRETAGPRVTSEWREDQPQDDIYLIAAPFSDYRRESRIAEARVYLRSPDPDLAAVYLAATEEYLSLYSELIGPYPYGKFALVENFWETGFGMPSFTLLGSRVLRLPFIVRTSYPHEILHNWWGNGVYIDYEGGNWSEGLTAYLADHLLEERAGRGPEYRRSALQRFTEYTAHGDDFPLERFRGRHGGASQAIGYDKSLMLFHMLRIRLGDAAFVAGLRRFYRDHRFRPAGFDDLRLAFEAETGEPLEAFFRQWLSRTGAPVIEVAAAATEAREQGYLLQVTLVQEHGAGQPYVLDIPLAVHLDGEPEAMVRTVRMDRARQTFALPLGARPLRLEVDPFFDVFRRLAAAELPPSLTQAFTAPTLTLVLPAAAPADLLDGYRALAERWADGQAGVRIISDRDLDRLPDQGAVWLLGWENRFLDGFRAQLPGDQAVLGMERFRLGPAEFPLAGHSAVATSSRTTTGSPGVLAWLGTDSPAALPGLARKLPHYGKYGYLVFRGPAPDNIAKGRWLVDGSPLQVPLAENPVKSRLPMRRALTDPIQPENQGARARPHPP